jgi:thiol-disulfide isomerase/thioredoxin
MGRLSIVVCAICASLAAACNDNKPPPPSATARSEVVLAKDAPSQAAPSASASAAPAAARVPRKLCDAEVTASAKSGRQVPKTGFDARSAPGTAAVDAKLDLGAGRWTWINFFAAWCGPCKEEIPRLRGWEQKLSNAMRVRFISLDDDERQLGKFLEQQPATGVKGSLWLKPGNNRDSFLEGLKLGSSPSLPAHALVDPQGHVRCSFQDAIDDADYAQIETIVAKR